MSPDPTTYAAAGVDTHAGDRAVDLMKAAVTATHGPEVVGGFGAFAGMWDASALKDFSRPLLATSTDGVGTKVAIAQALDVHHTIGHDLVGMVVDDIVVAGAKPLFMTDYIACGRVEPERIASIVRGIAEGAQLAGVGLVGGETAEHPGLLAPDEYDVAGACTGVVEADEVLGAERVRAGDAVIGYASSGLHANGYSLVRHIVARAGWELDREVPEFGRSLGAELLEPTRIYAQSALDLISSGVHAYSHVTGGGLAANVARILPAGLVATIDRSAWTVPPVFSVLGALGSVPDLDAEATWNLGIGWVAVVGAESVDEHLRRAASAGLDPVLLGSVLATDHVLATDDVISMNVATSSDSAVSAGAATRVGSADLPAGSTIVSHTKGVAGGAVALHGEYAR